MLQSTQTLDAMRWQTQELALSEFWHPPAPSTRNAAKWRADIEDDYTARWFGMPQAECLDLPARGWPAGVDAALRLIEAPDVAPIGASRLRRRWSPDDGETLDVARFYDGLPCWQQPHRAPGGSGGRIITLVAHAGGNMSMTATEIAWKAYAAVRYVDAMESAGFRVAVDVSCAARDCYHGGSGWHCLVHVKEPDDPVDLSQLAAVLSAAAYRWYGFAWKAVGGVTLRDGWGTNYDLRPTDPDAIYLPAEVTDRATARRWLASVNTDDGRA